MICKVNCSDFPGDKSSGNLGSSMFKSLPPLGRSSNLNLAVNQFSVFVVMVKVIAQLTPEIYKIIIYFT